MVLHGQSEADTRATTAIARTNLATATELRQPLSHIIQAAVIIIAGGLSSQPGAVVTYGNLHVSLFFSKAEPDGSGT